ncbi:helix-turn-helix transcriptional regulator [Leucobacter sp. 7(1)]|uniref:helix-turn-helix transcriptional regulator n=1 Tax=Leucobacter sp. 7(1) TaxID=1255613 RepID=UPI000B362363|nr:helix-turn-helix transcriptional regulator [Leucobacter sp. 7(1)]
MRKVSYQSRPHLVQVLRRYLLAGYDVELLSPRGNGGSRFLREFLAEIREHGQAAVLLPDVGDERPVPSVLLAALADQGRTIPNTTVSSPTELAAHMERAFGSRPLTLVVDGPQALTPLLQAAIALYRASAQLQIVLLCDRENTAPERAPQAVTVPLPTLTLEELGAVLNGVCGAPLDAGTLSRVYAKSAGLVKLAVAIAEVGVIEGNLKLVDGLWVAARDLWSPRLLPMVRSYAQGAGPEDADALEAIAVAGLVSAADAVSLIGADRVERLERQQLIAVEATGTRHWVTVNPPILGEMFRHGRSPMRLARVGAQIEEVTAKPVEALTPIDTRVRIGRIDPMMIRRVSEQRAVTLRTAHRAWEEHGSADAGLRYIDALVASSAPAAEALAVVALVSGLPLSSEQLARLRVWEARVLGYQKGDVRAALALLDDAGDRGRALGEYRGLVVAARMRLAADLDVIPVDAETQLADAVDLPLLVRQELRTELVAVHYARGHLAAASAGIAELRQWSQDRVGHRARVYDALVDLGAGRAEAATRTVSQGFEDAKDELDGTMMRAYTYVLFLLVLSRGQSLGIARVNELFTALGTVPVFPQNAHLGVRVCGLVSVNGSVEEIQGLVRELGSVPLSAGTLPGTSRAWAEAKLAATTGEVSVAAKLCWEDALDLRRRGGALAAAHSAVRSLEYRYDETRAEQLSGWLEGIDSEPFRAILDYLRARSRGHAAGVREVIQLLAAVGQIGHAMQAYRDLSRLQDVRNDHQLAADISAERDAFSSALESSGMDLLQMVATEAKLTRREEEVARLIAAGLTNRQIQEELVLSIRTVENHVHRLMRKLRVSSRQEVVDAVRGWVGEAAGEPA